MTLLLIAFNIGVFILLQPKNEPVAEARFLYERAVIPCEVTGGNPLTIDEIESGRCGQDTGPQPFPAKNVYLAAVTSMFLHGGWFHLLWNMWFLWIFGNNVEEAFGKIRYIALYLVAGLAATAGFTLLNGISTIPLIGASGAVAGVLGAYAVLFPRHRVLSLVFVMVIPVPAIVFLGVWFLSQFLIASETVAWQAHVVGFASGVAIALALRHRLARPIA